MIVSRLPIESVIVAFLFWTCFSLEMHLRMCCNFPLFRRPLTNTCTYPSSRLTLLAITVFIEGELMSRRMAGAYRPLHKYARAYLRNSWFSRDVTVAMLVYRTIAQKFFWEFDCIIMQNLSDILPLFSTPTWPSHHVTENQGLVDFLL